MQAHPDLPANMALDLQQIVLVPAGTRLSEVCSHTASLHHMHTHVDGTPNSKPLLPVTHH